MDMMDSRDEILRNVREVLGCNGVRRLEDLAPMRQETIERRLTAAASKLQPASMASIYATWLQEQAYSGCAAPPAAVVDRWCHYLARRGCGKAMLQVIWMQAALTVLDKWCAIMSPERVRDVRKDVCDAIAAAYPGEQDSNVRQHDRMDVEAATASGPSVPGRRGVAADDAMQVDDARASFAARDAGAGPAMVRATRDTPSDSGSELTMEERESSFGGSTAAKTQYTGDQYKVGGHYATDSSDQPELTEDSSSQPGLVCQNDDSKGHGDDQKWKPIEEMNEVELEALRQADAFLAKLSAEAGAAQAMAASAPAPPPQSTAAKSDHAPKKLKTRSGRARIPTLGALVEPARPKPKAPKVPAVEPTDEDQEMGDSGAPSTPKAAEPPVELGVTTMPLTKDGPFSAETLALFETRGNVWVNQVPRKTALEMWDEMDAKKAAEEEANKAGNKAAEEGENKAMEK
ncbi:hypothetical protein HRG_003725 [Hirsutella rhossiliensis]|uniref:Uncharacterized protein n=1 Tax=Hirsutella rhossiliensis TaxID=111463 RepID=A0A9P8N2L9_9HYPO|nr:uncharacterized protein HRG_03725 [Hirsutella rhossiliensis]KAH0965709.1 hypothetical protein HRG_03725 [Hirsutella rhossiliensis]